MIRGGSTHTRTGLRDNGAVKSALWAGAGFAAGIAFWHGVGFWALVSTAVLSGVDEQKLQAMPLLKSEASSPKPMATASITRPAHSGCITLSYNRSRSETVSAPCAGIAFHHIDAGLGFKADKKDLSSDSRISP
jgi:hypothetical protein